MNTQTQKSFKLSQLHNNQRAFNEKCNKDYKKEQQFLFSSGGRLRGGEEQSGGRHHNMAAPWRRGVVAMGTACGRARGRRGKMAAPVSVCHVACCANRAGGGAVSWGRRGLLAFGSCRDVVLYQPAVSGRGRAG